MKQLLATAFSALAVIVGATSLVVGDAPASDDTSTSAGASVRNWTTGPDGTDLQHNETLIRDGA